MSTSPDGINYTPVYSGTSTGTTTAAETYALGSRTSRRVRITFQGNTVNDWASITEARVCGVAAPAPLVRGVARRLRDGRPQAVGQHADGERGPAAGGATRPARQGSYALKVTVKQGDDPINASGNRNELVR